MALWFVITRDVEMRYRGFRGSIELELAPGVYASPRMSKAVRERVWEVLSDWHSTLGSGSIIMTWRDKTAPAGLRVLTLGELPKSLVEHEGHLLVRRPVRGQ